MKRNTNRGPEQVTLVREVIASGTVTRLDRCGCGDLYLTVGPITIALHPEALTDLHATLARAIASLGKGAEVSGAASLPPDDGAADAAGAEPPASDDELN